MLIFNFPDGVSQWFYDASFSQGKRQTVAFDVTLLCLKRTELVSRVVEGHLQASFTISHEVCRTVLGMPEGPLFREEDLRSCSEFLQGSNSFRVTLTATARVGNRIFATLNWLMNACGPDPSVPPSELAGKLRPLI